MARVGWLVAGGPVLWVILAGSVPVAALVAERSLAMLRARRAARRFLAAAEPLAGVGDRAGLARLAAREEGLLPAVTAAVLIGSASSRGGGIEESRARAAAAGAPWVEALDRGRAVIGVAASAAPLLGLLGTVTGLIRMFRQIQGADPGVDLLPLAARGLWEAMLTTVAGLMVAIPAAAVSHLLGAARDTLVARAEAWVERLVSLPSPPSPVAEGGKEGAHAQAPVAAPRGAVARRP